jgi:hypothetical protein
MSEFHLTIASVERLTLFPAEAAVRAAVRAIARVVGSETALFCIVDDHLHMVVIGDRGRTGRIAQAVGTSLGPLTEARLQPAFVKPVESRSHMERLLGYLLCQPDHHQVARRWPLWTGSCFLDLAGARVLPGLRLRLVEALPRFDLRDAYHEVGLPPEPVGPVAIEEIRVFGIVRLVEASAACLAVGPDLRGRDASVVEVRAVAARLAQAAGIPRDEMAFGLKVTPQTAGRLLQRSVDEAALRAVRQRLALERLASDAPAGGDGGWSQRAKAR